MSIHQHRVVSGTMFTVVLCLWPLFMALAPHDGTVSEQFQWIQAHRPLHIAQFVFALLLSPTLVYLMLAQIGPVLTRDSIPVRLGMFFLTAYLVLNSIAYGSQLVVLPHLIERGTEAQAILWSMNSPTSLIYFLNQMGYCFWGGGTLLLFYHRVAVPGMIRVVSLIYLISATLSILAFVGLILANPTLNSFTLYSGLLLLPVGIITVVWGWQDSKHQYTASGTVESVQSADTTFKD